jgi:hypothetical protein
MFSGSGKVMNEGLRDLIAKLHILFREKKERMPVVVNRASHAQRFMRK